MLITVASHLLSTAFCACETKRSAFVLKAVASFFPNKTCELLKFFEVLPSHTLYSLPWRLVPSLAPCFYPMIKTKYLVMNSEMWRVNFLVCSAECWTNSYHDEPSVMHLFDYNSQESLLLLQFWSDLNQLAHNDRLHITVTCELWWIDRCMRFIGVLVCCWHYIQYGHYAQ